MSIFQKNLEYNSQIDKVVNVQFSMLSPEEMKRRSVGEIFTTDTYDGDIPRMGGLFDPRMGVLDNGLVCPTDGLDNRFCPGYFGHISLAKPIYNYQFINYILKILKNVCLRCSKLYINSALELIT